LEATEFGRGKFFQKLPKAEKEVLLNSRKKMLVIREPLQSKDLNYIQIISGKSYVGNFIKVTL